MVPANIPPHRELSGPSGEDRAAMVSACIRPYRPELELEEIEIKRGGVSYSFDTLKELNKKYKPENIFFIMGADAFAEFPQWKNFPQLLELSNFVVSSRPGASLSLAAEDLPEGLEDYVKFHKEKSLKLKTNREIIELELEDIDVSSTELRKRLRAGHEVSKWIPQNVIELIAEKSLYKRSSPLVADYRDFSKFCSLKALDKKALDLKIYDMTKLNAYAEYSVICSATSNRHAASIGEGIIETVKEDYGLTPISIEGMRDGHWVLIDYGSVVVHIFQDAVRTQYKIEDLWRKCPQFQNEIKELKTQQAKKATKDEGRSSRP